MPEVYCPFASDGVCRGGCPTNRERACIDGEPSIPPGIQGIHDQEATA